MQMLEIKDLKPHPKNEELFDDIEGQRWSEFKESILRRGVVEPIVVTQDLVIVSGHQRVKACKELEIKTIPCRITHYPEFDEKTDTPKEDMILEDLISTNIMQRGVGNINPLKMAKCIKELERIKGIRNGSANEKGNNRIGDGQNVPHQTNQSDLAEELNISPKHLRRFKSLLNLIPELQDLVETGELKASIGYTVLSKLPKEEQEKVIEDLGQDKLKEMTQKELKLYVNKIKELNAELEKTKKEVTSPKVVTQIVEKTIDNTDYTLATKLKEYKDKLEKQNKVISSNEKMIKDQEGLIDSLKKLNASQDKAIKEKYARYDKLDELERQIKNATRRKDDIDRAIESGTELSGLIVEIENFLKTKLCPINYSRAIFEQKNSPVVIENVTEIVSVVEQWCYDMKKMIKTTINSDEYDGEIIDVEINK